MTRSHYKILLSKLRLDLIHRPGGGTCFEREELSRPEPNTSPASKSTLCPCRRCKCWVECCSTHQHLVKRSGALAGHGHVGLLHAWAFGHAHRQTLKHRSFYRPGENNVGGLIQRNRSRGVTNPRVPSCHIRLARLALLWSHTKICADHARGPKAGRIIDRRQLVRLPDCAHNGGGHPELRLRILLGEITDLVRKVSNPAIQFLAGQQKHLGDHLQSPVYATQFTQTTRETVLRRYTDLEPDATQDTVQVQFYTGQLSLEQPACRQCSSQFLSRHRLVADRPEPDHPQLREPSHILAIRLHRHGLERCPHVTGLQTLNSKPHFLEPLVQSLRQRLHFQADPRNGNILPTELGHQRHTDLTVHPPGRVDTAHI